MKSDDVDNLQGLAEHSIYAQELRAALAKAGYVQAAARAVVASAGGEVLEPWSPECDLGSQALHEALGALAGALGEPAAPEPSATPDPDELGRIVREEWVAWAKRQPFILQHWLATWEDTPEASRDLARRLGERLFAVGAAWGAAPGARGEAEEVVRLLREDVETALLYHSAYTPAGQPLERGGPLAACPTGVLLDLSHRLGVEVPS